jgi:hypothetical protein
LSEKLESSGAESQDTYLTSRDLLLQAIARDDGFALAHPFRIVFSAIATV